jgi:hypothetical protein
MRRWTAETDREADELFPTLTTTEIRRRQDLCRQQTALAYEARNEDALLDLQAMADALTREMFGRTEPGWSATTGRRAR